MFVHKKEARTVSFIQKSARLFQRVLQLWVKFQAYDALLYLLKHFFFFIIIIIKREHKVYTVYVHCI